MTSWAQIKEGLGHVNSQLTAGTAVTAEVLMNLTNYLAAVTDIGNRTESEYSRLIRQLTADFGEVRQRVLMHQGAIDVLTTKPEKGHAGITRGILENKSVASLPMLGTDKNSFRNWNDRMVNVVVNVRPGTRKLFQSMMEYVDQESGGNRGKV